MRIFSLLIFSIYIQTQVNDALSCSYNALFYSTAIPGGGDCPYGTNGESGNCDECGLKFASPNVKIVGGQEATAYSWPSMALLVFRYKFYFVYNGYYYSASPGSYCGGSLITRSKVLTAAHCFIKTVRVSVGGSVYSFSVTKNSFYPTYESMYTVYLGLHNKYSAINNFPLDSSSVAKSINSFNLHYNFNDNYLNDDIAIIKLNSDVTLNCYVQVACLPNPDISNYPTSNFTNTWAVGWGLLTYNGISPNNLNNVKLTLYIGSYCTTAYGSSYFNVNKQVCAGEYNGGKGICQGDSGGPLFVQDTVNGVTKYILVGITSYTNKGGCADARYPQVYTKVSSYLDWIKNYETQSINSNSYTPASSTKKSASTKIEINVNFYFILIITIILNLN